ncbi:MAG TPA: aminotransferase class V-fold PLP-dependent enzyme [Thermodesulfobacteriota bacterium]|nr:aminotransferase class V-fold PLP-dependent enzyme [Thermodesulfobacteriota bacterium]
MNSDKKLFEIYRDEFPVTKSYIYLDHAGVAPVSLSVKRAVEKFLSEATKSGMFNYKQWMDRVEEIRKKCATFIGADPEEIAFVKNTSHGISMVAEGLDWKEGDNLLICEKDFPSNIYPWLNLKRKGIEIGVVPSQNGRILIEDIEGLIDSRTKLLTVSSVNFSSGFKIDLEVVGRLCKEKGILFFVDAIQSLGVIPMNVHEFEIDFLAADGHKWLLSPEGTGIFYCRKELALMVNPPLIGWKSIINESDYDHIDFRLKTNSLRFEEGSLNVMGIFALGAAIDLLIKVGIDRIQARVIELGDLIIREAEKRDFLVRTPKNKEERGGIISIIGDFDPINVKDRLKEEGILVNVRGGAIRISPHFYNTEYEVLRLFDAIDRVVKSK